MNVDEYIKSQIKKPVQRGNTVYVYDGNGRLVNTYPTLELGEAWFSMSNDGFYNLYGFSFVPQGIYWELSKRKAGKM